jgi:hypothetical protein
MFRDADDQPARIFIVAPRAAALDRVFAELAAATARDKPEIGQLLAIATIEPAAEADSGDRRLLRGHGPESQESSRSGALARPSRAPAARIRGCAPANEGAREWHT